MKENLAIQSELALSATKDALQEGSVQASAWKEDFLRQTRELSAQIDELVAWLVAVWNAFVYYGVPYAKETALAQVSALQDLLPTPEELDAAKDVFVGQVDKTQVAITVMNDNIMDQIDQALVSTSEVQQSLLSKVAEVREHLPPADEIQGEIASRVGEAKGYISSAVDSSSLLLSELGHAAEETKNTIAEQVQSQVNTMQSSLPSLEDLEAVKTAVVAQAGEVQAQVSGFKDNLMEQVDQDAIFAQVDAVRNAIPDPSELAVRVEEAQDYVQSTAANLGGVVGQAKNSFVVQFQAVKEAFVALFARVSRFQLPGMNLASLEGLKDAVLTKIGSASSALKSWASNLPGLLSKVGDVTEKVRSAGDVVKDQIAVAQDTISEIQVPSAEVIVVRAKDVQEAVTSSIDQLPKAIVESTTAADKGLDAGLMSSNDLKELLKDSF
jgi:hypothetical protein